MGAPTPGELGPAIIVGHVDWDGPGVFFDLHRVAVGDEIVVTRLDGSVAIFEVTDTEEYPKDEFPTVLVFGELDYSGLRLITCGGTFNRKTGHYEDNVVVFAKLVRHAIPVQPTVPLIPAYRAPYGNIGDVPAPGTVWLPTVHQRATATSANAPI